MEPLKLLDTAAILRSWDVNQQLDELSVFRVSLLFFA